MAEYIVSSGVTSTGVTLNYDSMYVLNAGTANGTIVDRRGSMFISSGGVANSTTINSSGSMKISSGGVANSTTVNSSGSMDISGGVANSTSVNSDGGISISSGGIANSTSVNNYGSMFISSGGVANSTSVNENGSMFISDGGVANSTTVNTNGYVAISDGGVANSTNVNENGSMFISDGGVANSTSVNENGFMFISSGGVAGSTIVNGGHIDISSGGVVSSISVNENGSMFIFGGGVANNTIVNSGGSIDISGGEANSTTINGGHVDISNSGVANSATVNENGFIVIFSGGVANSGTVNSGGSMFISGGEANGTTINKNGFMVISCGGYAGSVIVESGGDFVLKAGGVAETLSAASGVTIVGWTLNQDQLLIRVDDDGVHGAITNATIQDTTAKLGSGGVANSTTVNANGSMYISSGGVANSTTIGGRTDVSSYCYERDDYDYYYETIYDYSFYYNDVYGSMQILSGGRVNDTTINKLGVLHISSGGKADRTRISGASEHRLISTTSNSYRFYFYDEMYHDAFLNGSMIVSDGGFAADTTIDEYGIMTISSGGMANSTTINSGGSIYIDNGGVHSGSLQIVSGGTVSAYAGAIIDFTVAEQSDAAVALINNWSLISGGNNADYTLTVESNQASGIYALAGGASGFTNSVTVKTTENTVLGTLSVGETKTFGETDYTLALTGGNLSLTITGEEPISKPTKSDVDGNNISEIVFQYTGGNYQIGFWMNGTNTWQGQGIGQPQDWELIGAYDMDQDGKADIVMRGNIQIGSDKGAYIGYYVDGDVNNWQNISYLNNPNDIDWRLAIGNITGNEGCNSLVWYSPELGALGVWTDGTDNWVSLGSGYDYSWTLEGCGDFDGDGKDDILFCHDGNLYCTDIDNNFRSLGGWGTDWKVCTTGDFSGDGKDDIILQNGNMVVKFEDGLAENWESIGVMDATDWFIVGAGDYNGDQEEDLLVRQYSTGMLGYYESGDMDKWVEVGRGVDMNWTVIA